MKLKQINEVKLAKEVKFAYVELGDVGYYGDNSYDINKAVITASVFASLVDNPETAEDFAADNGLGIIEDVVHDSYFIKELKKNGFAASGYDNGSAAMSAKGPSLPGPGRLPPPGATRCSGAAPIWTTWPISARGTRRSRNWESEARY